MNMSGTMAQLYPEAAMRYNSILFILFLLAPYLLVLPAAAETRYVVDELVITLRLGKSTEHKIIRTLKTGTPLEILEDDDETYLKVRTSDGVEGYVLRQYVTTDPPKIKQLEELQMLNSSLQKKIDLLEEAKSNLEMELKTTREEYAQNFSEISTKSTDMEQSLEQALNNERTMAEKYQTLLDQAGNVVAIAAERDELLQKNKILETDVISLRQKNDSLVDSRMIKWFLAGGGVFFFGWIIGKISRKKRSRL